MIVSTVTFSHLGLTVNVLKGALTGAQQTSIATGTIVVPVHTPYVSQLALEHTSFTRSQSFVFLSPTVLVAACSSFYLQITHGWQR